MSAPSCVGAARDPIRLGMWVGGGVSQNRIDDAAEATREAHDRGRVYGASPKQLVSCPWCGTRSGAQDLTLDSYTRRALLYCSGTSGECPFNAAIIAIAEPTTSLYETELIRPRGPGAISTKSNARPADTSTGTATTVSTATADTTPSRSRFLPLHQPTNNNQPLNKPGRFRTSVIASSVEPRANMHQQSDDG